MVNKNYRSGRAKEYRIKKQYEKAGMIVLRTAGSHGFADLIVIDKNKKTISFIQCKPNNASEALKTRLEALYNWANDEFMSEFVVK